MNEQKAMEMAKSFPPIESIESDTLEVPITEGIGEDKTLLYVKFKKSDDKTEWIYVGCRPHR